MRTPVEVGDLCIRCTAVCSINLSADLEGAKGVDGDAEDDSLDFRRAAGMLSMHNSRRKEEKRNAPPRRSTGSEDEGWGRQLKSENQQD